MMEKKGLSNSTQVESLPFALINLPIRLLGNVELPEGAKLENIISEHYIYRCKER